MEKDKDQLARVARAIKKVWDTECGDGDWDGETESSSLEDMQFLSDHYGVPFVKMAAAAIAAASEDRGAWIDSKAERKEELREILDGLNRRDLTATIVLVERLLNPKYDSEGKAEAAYKTELKKQQHAE